MRKPFLSTPSYLSSRSLSKSTTVASSLEAHIPNDASELKYASVGCIFEGNIAKDNEFMFEDLSFDIKVGNEALPIPSQTDATTIALRSFSMGFFFNPSINVSSCETNGNTLYQK